MFFFIDEIPESDLLTPVIGPMPVQNGIEMNCMFLPLPSLLDHALSLPLLTQYASHIDGIHYSMSVIVCMQELSGELCPPGPLSFFLSHDQPLPVPKAVPVAGRRRICTVTSYAALPPGKPPTLVLCIPPVVSVV